MDKREVKDFMKKESAREKHHAKTEALKKKMESKQTMAGKVLRLHKQK